MHRLSSIALSLALASLSLAQAGCKKPRTEVVLDIDTNITERALPDFRVQCAYNWDGEAERDDIPGCSAEYTRGAGGAVSAVVCLPGSIGLTIDPARDSQPFTLVVSGANNRYRHIMRVTPVAEEFRLLRVRVHSDCLAVSPESAAHPCPASAGNSCTLSESCMDRGMTCGNSGTCVAREVAQSNLESIPRTGPADAGLTQSVDGACPLSNFPTNATDASTSAPDSATEASTSMPDGATDSGASTGMDASAG